MARKRKRIPNPGTKPATVQKAQSPRQEDVDVDKTIRRQQAINRRNERVWRQTRNAMGYNGTDSRQRKDGLRSIFYDPMMLDTNHYGTVRTINPYYGRHISYKILRAVSQKAWILNICILNVIRKIRPYLKPSTSENQRGFRIKKKDVEKMSDAEQERAKELTQFFMKTGDVDDRDRKDDLDKYTTKIMRDLFQLDQISTEIQRTRDGEVCAFWAMDTATIEVALPNEDEIDYVQVIYNVPYAYFTDDDMIFDCMNPRTDIEKAGYGYSLVEQAIDLITSAINTFMYNAGFFQENKLPRGILLLQGDADTEEIEEIEDYIANLLSGPPTAQWHVPIIPSGRPDGSAEGGNRKFEWIDLHGTSKEMEFREWFDLQLSGVVSLFGETMESLGLHSQKSQALIGADITPRVESTKSLVLGDTLTFLQKHFNQILEFKDPEYEVEIVGYEKDDPKITIEIDKEEVGNWKSIDEKRIEKGLEPFEKPWSQVPLNPYVLQLMGQEQAGPFGGDMGGGEFGEEEEPGDMEDETEGEEEDEGSADGAGWDELEEQQGGGTEDEKKPVEKSMNKRRFMEIVV